MTNTSSEHYAYKYKNSEGTTYLTLSEGFVEHLIKMGRIQSDNVELTIVSW